MFKKIGSFTLAAMVLGSISANAAQLTSLTPDADNYVLGNAPEDV